MRYPIKLLNLLIVTFLIILLPACHVGRFFYWNFAGINDYKKFPAVPVNRGSETFYFDKAKKQINPELPGAFATGGKNYSLDQFLEKNKNALPPEL